MIKSENIRKKKKYPALLGLGYRYQRDENNWSFGINYFRCLVLFIVLLVLFWSLAASAIYFFMKYRRGFEDMTIVDAYIMPFDSADINRRHGDAIIEKAKLLLEEKEYLKAFKLFQAGSIKSPMNMEGRKSLAELEVQIYRRPDFALRTLEMGVPYALSDLEYMRFYLSLLLKELQDKRVIVLGDFILQSEKASMPVKVFTAMTMSTVYAMHGNYEKSSELILEYKIDKTLAGILRVSKNFWEMGKTQEAIDYAKKAYALGDVDLEPIYSILMNYSIELKDYDTARFYAIRRRLSRPFSISHHLDYIELLARNATKEQVDNEMKVVYDLAKSKVDNLVYLANYAADNAKDELMKKVYSIAVENDYSLPIFTLLMVDSYLLDNNPAEAEKILSSVYETKPIWFARNKGLFDCLYATTYASLGDEALASIKVNEIMSADYVTPRSVLATVRRLDKVGSIDLAYKLLTYLVEKNPTYQLALVRLIELEMKMGNTSNLDKRMDTLMNIRRAPRSILVNIRESMDSDRFIFAPNREKIIEEMDKLLGSNIYEDKAMQEKGFGAEDTRIID